MIPCDQLSCCLCYPLYKLTDRNDQSVVQFGPNQQYIFINGYRSILNCPATCTTNNIIYCLTCPYDHQEHGNRILQEVLPDSSTASPIMARHSRYENNVEHVLTQTSDTMTTDDTSPDE
ncbi:unnamed protein product [Rotaria sp. Silwood2]|nr:unnamed protein product [Rotaria sp. Silwood2]CAF4316841.1 unnamed protein product [Rotaria sp. Silwood2]